MEKGNISEKGKHIWESMNNPAISDEVNIDTDELAAEGFDFMQIIQIQRGMEEHLPVEIYKKPEYDFFQMEQIRFGLKEGLDISVYAKPEYSHMIMRELRLALTDKISLEPYLSYVTDGRILKEIRLGLRNGIDLGFYAKQGFDNLQLEEIRIAKESHVPIDEYISISFFGTQLREIRLGIENHVDVSVYATGEYDWFQMRELRLGLEEHLDVMVYARRFLNWRQMEQIRLGLEQYLDVSSYALVSLSPDAMRHRRMALLKIRTEKETALQIARSRQQEKLESSYIAKNAANDAGRTANEGLKGEAAGDNSEGAGNKDGVRGKESFSSKDGTSSKDGANSKEGFGSKYGINKTEDISRAESVGKAEDELDIARLLGRARELSSHDESGGIDPELEKIFKTAVDTGVQGTVEIKEDGIVATLELRMRDDFEDYTTAQIVQFLNDNQVKQGIDKAAIEKMIKENKFYQPVVVARGREAVDGQDGKYTFLFATETPTIPKIMQDGSVDYFDMKLFEFVEKDQLLAEYAPATMGSFGYKVTGEMIVPKKGQDLPPLRGSGFYMSQDRSKYFASIRGKISLLGAFTMEITNVFVVNKDVDVGTGNIRFDGDVLVKGDVRTGYAIIAQGDVCVEGHVEGARIKSGQDIVVKKGMNGNNIGVLEAGGNISGTFFEAVNMNAGKNINANYILNSFATCGGKIEISGKKGSILGGRLCAASGILAYTVGNFSGTRNRLQVGITEDILKEYQEMVQKLKRVEAEVQVIQKGKAGFDKNPSTNPEVVELKRKIALALDMKIEECMTTAAKRDEIAARMEVAEKAVIKILGTVNEGTKVTVSMCEMEVAKPMTHVYFAHKGKRVAIMKM